MGKETGDWLLLLLSLLRLLNLLVVVALLEFLVFNLLVEKFIDLFYVSVRFNFAELIYRDLESLKFLMDFWRGFLFCLCWFLCHNLYATFAFSVFNANSILERTSSFPMISMIVIRSGPPAVPVTANRSAGMI